MSDEEILAGIAEYERRALAGEDDIEHCLIVIAVYQYELDARKRRFGGVES